MPEVRARDINHCWGLSWEAVSFSHHSKAAHRARSSEKLTKGTKSHVTGWMLSSIGQEEPSTHVRAKQNLGGSPHWQNVGGLDDQYRVCAGRESNQGDQRPESVALTRGHQPRDSSALVHRKAHLYH